MPGRALPVPVWPPVSLRVKEMVLISWLAGRVHVERRPVRPAAAPAHAPHLPLVAGDHVEELLLLHEVRQRDKHPVVWMALEQGPTADAAVGRAEDLRFILENKI